MRLLAFDTSGKALSAAAVEDGQVRAERAEPLARGHAERLLPVLREVMADAGWDWRALDLIAPTSGPGSFTGLRAGIAVARALSLALPCPVLGVGSLEVLAEAAAPRAAGRPILAVLDVGREEIAWQRFAPDLMPLAPPALAARGALQDLVQEPCVTVGEMVAVRAAEAANGRGTVEAALHARYVAAVARRRLAAGVRTAQGFALHPLYLRAPDARLSAGRSLVAAVS